ncbi:MAG: hypothetical protein ABFR05_06285 [Bacteroidota bacterium]
MKKMLLLLFLNSFMINSQTVLDSTLIEIPFIGKNGGAHLLNWTLNDEKNEIYLYAYSHINGSQIVTNEEEIKNEKEKYGGKGYFGKIIASSKRDNYYENSIIPIVYEKILGVNQFEPISEKKELFHRIESLPEGMKVYFKKKSGMVDLSLPFDTGEMLKYHYKDLNIPFPYAPKYNSDIINFTSFKMKGDGLLGLKNIRPILTSERGFFTYDESKGYISTTEQKDIIDISKDERLKGYKFVPYTDKTIGDYNYAWYMKEDDLSNYKMIIYNKQEGNLSVKSFEFEAPRKHKVINKAVYDKDMNLKGVLNIYGYHRKGKKKQDIYPVNKFDLIYMDTSGNIKFQTKLDYGSEKKYKNVISPVFVIEKNEEELELINNKMLSYSDVKYEMFSVNKSGDINISFSEKNSEVKNDVYINYYDYLSDYDKIDKLGDYYIVRKVISDNVNVTTKDSKGNLITESKPTDSKINYSLLDKNFKPLDFYSFPANPNVISNLEFQTIENKDDEIVVLAKKKKNYYMIKITGTSNTPKIEFTPFKIAYSKKSSATPYFGNFATDFALVDKENRQFYILSQFYHDHEKYNAKVIDKIGITKLKY